ncbi:ABC transporter substrate-binding protein [Actinokineospora terrae]|uniref:Polar amino acid transport system substrate-binding protein n=1 Tax=Actinokineospora terrae TaxID=155974 RepID=A0A1H9W489_9PSEU|nr:ABC transporter substrate-binding protein [Actinokineospora terrae]SES28698.1 polar amino acid transport system substrate-binding protein [Actinokineospora terrae]
MARRSKLKVLALLPALALAVAACGSSDGGTTGSSGGNTAANGVKLVEAGKIKTCTNLPYPPFQFKQGDKTVGFDVDMVDLAAKKLGVTQEIVDIQFDVIKSGAALNSGKCDVAAAGMTITDERKQNLDFTNPYFDEVIALLVPKGSGITSLDQLKDKKIGVQRGTTSLDYATGKGFTPTEFEDSGKQLQAYQAGQVDAVLQDLPVVNEWLKKQGLGEKFEIGAEIETGAQYGIAVKKGGNPELLKTLNDALDAAIKDGTWAKSYEQWMGSKPKSTPSGK